MQVKPIALNEVDNRLKPKMNLISNYNDHVTSFLIDLLGPLKWK